MIYRKEIDGLRAVAVLPVILFHAGLSAFSGGFVGVDVFFVISGYLITTIILGEREAGTFTLINFYERRARRILPALFFVILACLPFAWLWMMPGQFKDFFQSIAAVAVFSSNILFWLETGYFAPVAELKPLLHTWSLAVEEQYYLLFPLFLMCTWRLGRRVMVVLLVIIGLLSLGVAHWASSHYPTANFYLLPSRLWELLIGSLVAFYLFYKQVPAETGTASVSGREQAASLLGLAMIVYAIFMFDHGTPFPGLAALLPTLGTALIILFAKDGTWVNRWLSNRLFVGIGLISYSAYLWHQPLFAFARIRSVPHTSEVLMLSLAGLALLLAYLSWRYVEKPFRNKARINRQQIFAAALACSVAFLGVGLLGDYHGGVSGRVTADGTPLEELRFDHLEGNRGLSHHCEGEFTTRPECRTHAQPEILVWGDSFAMHLIDGILASNPEARLIQMTKSLCGPILNLEPTNADYPVAWSRQCADFNNQVLEWLRHNDSVKYVAISSPFHQYLTDESGWSLYYQGQVLPLNDDLVVQQFGRTLDTLTAMGLRAVVFAPPPADGSNMGGCLAKAVFYAEPTAKCDFTLADFSYERRDGQAFLRRMDQEYDVVWFNELMCPDGQNCTTVLQDVLMYRDDGHFSRDGSRLMGRTLDFYSIITGRENHAGRPLPAGDTAS